MIIQPEISVILSTYNRNRDSGFGKTLIERAIDSILSQSFFDFELILIDDASNDGTKEVCENYVKKDGRIRFFRHEENSGKPAKRYNEGILASRGKYITFMFDDDLWHMNHLNDLYCFFEWKKGHLPNLGMVYGQAILINVLDNSVISEAFGENYDIDALHLKNILANLSVMVLRDVFFKVGGYDEADCMRRTCDWELWQRISHSADIARLEKLVGTVYAFHHDSVGCRFDRTKGVFKLRHLFQRDLLPLRSTPISFTEKTYYLYRIYMAKLSEKFPLLNKNCQKTFIKTLMKRLGILEKAKTLYAKIKN